METGGWSHKGKPEGDGGIFWNRKRSKKNGLWNQYKDKSWSWDIYSQRRNQKTLKRKVPPYTVIQKNNPSSLPGQTDVHTGI
ncbi:hypothetical protein X943_002992 [Babesia divergens]|uniref:Uncharacterized protein n=1 Tax=Babesia divergens TaxID=32595 RepID=A0AAD9LD04_BABDI|nr:hypothetical protein X943_002992 [Babesia divergens]